MSFIETPRFPDKISSGSTGGPAWDTKIIISGSGYEQRDQRWSNALHQYNCAFGIRDIDDLDDLKRFFMAMRGMTYGFRYKDWADYKSTSVEKAPGDQDQYLGDGDGIETQFQLVKAYDEGFAYARPINKPVTGTVLVSVNGVSQPTGWTVDTTTGLITFDVAPTAGHAVRAGYEFDVPCRFASDELPTQIEVYNVGSAQVPVTEIRL